jgi:hypothetical protein
VRTVLIDESKRKGYVVVAAVVRDEDRRPIQQALVKLTLRGQRRLHMVDESMARRRLIVGTVIALPIACMIFDAGQRFETEARARAACLRSLVRSLQSQQERTQLVLERDTTVEQADRRVLFESVQAAERGGQFFYQHRYAYEEPLLAIPDIVAWCWTRSKEWRSAVSPLVGQSYQV